MTDEPDYEYADCYNYGYQLNPTSATYIGYMEYSPVICNEEVRKWAAKHPNIINDDLSIVSSLCNLFAQSYGGDSASMQILNHVIGHYAPESRIEYVTEHADVLKILGTWVHT